VFLQESSSAGPANTQIENIVIGHCTTMHDPKVQAIFHGRGEHRQFAFDVAASGKVRLWQVGLRGWKLLRETVLESDAATSALPPPESCSDTSGKHLAGQDLPDQDLPGYALAVAQLPRPGKAGPMAAMEVLIGPKGIGITTRRGIYLGIGASSNGRAALQPLPRPFRRYQLMPRIEPRGQQALPPLAAVPNALVEARFRGRSTGIHAVWDGLRMLFASTHADASQRPTPVLAVAIRAQSECVGYCLSLIHISEPTRPY